MARARINTDVETLPFGAEAVAQGLKKFSGGIADDTTSPDGVTSVGQWLVKFQNGTDQEQIADIKRVYEKTKAYEYLCGGLLSIVEQRIFDGKKQGYSSLNDWIDKNYSVIGMSRSEAYRYRAIYLAVDFDTFQEIGPSKAYMIASVKDEEVREKLTKYVQKDPAVTMNALKEKQEALMEKANKPKVEHREVVEDRAEEISISVLLNGPRQIVINIESQRVRDLLNDLLQHDLDRYKTKIAEQLIADKIPSQK